MESPKVTKEIRRSDGDPTRSMIRKHLPVVESRLSIAAGDTTSARERECYRWASSIDLITCKSRLGGERKEGVDDVGRREASLVTSAMSGSAISDRCTVT